jgi:hypothetical protein
MTTTLRVFFLQRVLREKLLLVAFVAIGAAIWISSFSGRMGSFWDTMSRTTTQLEDQQKWLNDRLKIDAAAQKAAEQLDRAKTLDGTNLFLAVRQLAADAGLTGTGFRGEAGPQRSSNERFSFNTLNVTITLNEANAPKNWEAVKKFYISLQQRSPYIVIDQLVLQPPGQRNAGQLTLVVKVSALQIH